MLRASKTLHCHTSNLAYIHVYVSYWIVTFKGEQGCPSLTGHSTHFQVGGDDPKVEGQEYF